MIEKTLMLVVLLLATALFGVPAAERLRLEACHLATAVHSVAAPGTGSVCP